MFIAIGRAGYQLSGVEFANQCLREHLVAAGVPNIWIPFSASEDGMRGGASASSLRVALRALLRLHRVIGEASHRRALVYMIPSQGGLGLARDVLIVLTVRLRLRPPRLVIHLHGEYRLPRGRRQRLLRQIAYRFIAHSAEVVLSCIRGHRFQGRNTIYISNLGLLRSLPRRDVMTQRPTARRLGYLGTISPGKGAREIVALSRRASSAAIEIRLVGSLSASVDAVASDQVSPRQWDVLKVELARAPVAVLGRLSGSAKDGEMATWAAAFFPSCSEGLPISVLEARLLGIPTVVTDVGDMGSLGADPGLLLVPPGDEDALWQAVCRALQLGRVQMPTDLFEAHDYGVEILSNTRFA